MRPSEGLAVADRLLTNLATDGEDRAQTLATRGRANYELGNIDRALIDLRSALDDVSGRFRDRVAIALAAAEFAGGDGAASERLLVDILEAESEPDADATVIALARSQLGMIRLNAGENEAAAPLLDASIGPLSEAPEEADALARVVANAGTCHLQLGNLQRALDLFDEAIALGRAIGHDAMVAGCLQNKACVLSQLGEFPAALDQFDQARARYERSGTGGRNLSTLFDDMAETYRLAGLTSDAIAKAKEALHSVEGRGDLEKEGDALYRLAVCLLDHGDHRRAADVAHRAGTLFREAGRTLWMTRAMLTALEAASADRAGSPEEIELVEQAIEQLERSGWRGEALRLRNRMQLIGLATADRGLIERFDDADPQSAEPGPGDSESVLSYLEVRLHQAIANLARSGRAGEPLAGVQSALDSHRLRLADPELRAGSGRLAEAFRFISMTEAMDDGDPATILATEDRWRTSSLRLPRARPSADPEVAELTTQLRDASRQAAEANEPDPTLGRRVQALEERLRAISHRTTAAEIPVGLSPFHRNQPTDDLLSALTEELGDKSLVQWFEHRHQLYGVSLAHGRTRLWEVGPMADVGALAVRIGRELTRLIYTAENFDVERRWRRIVERANDLGRQMLGGTDTSAGLVASPPSSLPELPWALLTPTLGDPVTLTRSATAWLGAGRVIDEPAIHVITGPDLGHGAEDGRAAAAHFASVEADPVGSRAVIDRAMAEADLLHIAAHGTFRRDSPMFSSLRLHDGDFALHELTGFERVPAVVTIAACDAGRSVHRAGGTEPLGTAPAWLSAGVETVVAPICAVPDRLTAEVFSQVYEALPGRTPAEALASAWAELADAEAEVVATATAFLCFGRGGPVIGAAASPPPADRPAGHAGGPRGRPPAGS